MGKIYLGADLFLDSSSGGGGVDLDTLHRILYPIYPWDAGIQVASAAGIGLCQLTNGWILSGGSNSGRVYKSIDNGLTWDSGIIVVSGGNSVSSISQLANGDILISGGDSRLYTSSNNGASYSSMASPHPFFNIIQLADGNLLANNSDDKVYISTDLGLTWDAGTVVTGTQNMIQQIQLANGDIALISNGGTGTSSIFKSTDNGITWDSGVVISSLSAVSGICQLSNGWILANEISGSKVYLSKDNGLTWDRGRPTNAIGNGYTMIQLQNGWIAFTHGPFIFINTLFAINP